MAAVSLPRAGVAVVNWTTPPSAGRWYSPPAVWRIRSSQAGQAARQPGGLPLGS